MKSIRLFVFMLLMGLAGTTIAAAEEAAKPAETAAPAEGQAAPDPAMMEKMKAAMAPGEAHKALEPLAGKWTYKSKFWMKADAPAEESSGTSESEMIYGGRFLKETVKGTWNGEP